jgi:hypothetical protein
MPNDQTSYINRFGFDTDLYGNAYTTIGAGPVGPYLQSDIGRTTDMYEPSFQLAEIFPGVGDTENALIERMFAMDRNYSDNLVYNPYPEINIIPDIIQTAYNSNSYAIGFLNALGADTAPVIRTIEGSGQSFPGIYTPVPTGSFSSIWSLYDTCALLGLGDGC